MKKTFYVTTPLYYPNDIPHIGHAYTTIAADIVARYRRLAGYDVFFLTGTDEHGEKIRREAEKVGLEPKEFIDNLIPKYKEIWKILNLSYDYFIRTTDKKHIAAVKKILKKVYDKGDIYEGEYEGWYCVPCETYLTDLQLKNEACPECGRGVEKLTEPTYYFKLSKYQNSLLNFYDKHPKFIQPKSRKNETISRVEDELKDLSISRINLSWGIPLPWDKKHSTYVWFDALTNYISALDWPGGKKFKKYWPADVHLIGKDILWFHTVIWPAMLLSAGVEPPKQVFGHGWWTVDGEKMSKSKGNVINPANIAKQYGADQLRYFLFRENTFGEDGDFSEEKLKIRINSELADDLGNLINRVIVMTNRYFKGVIPILAEATNLETQLESKFDFLKDYKRNMDNLNFSGALDIIWEKIKLANKYINDTTPWALAEGSDRLSTIIYTMNESIRLIALALHPFLPTKSEEIATALGIKIESLDELKWGLLKSGTRLTCKNKILFEKTK